MPNTAILGSVQIVVEGGPNVSRLLKCDSKITVDALTPGTENYFFVSIISGTKLSNMHYVPTVKTCTFFHTCIIFFNFSFVYCFKLNIFTNAVIFKDLL